MSIKKNATAAAVAAVAAVAPAAAAGATTAPKKTTKVQAKPPAQAVVPATETPAPSPKVPASKITRKELASAVRAKVTNAGAAISPKVAEIAIVAYEECVAEALAAGHEVNLSGFGKFVALNMAESTKRNPATGASVTVPAHKAVKFRIGGKLKAAVNGSPFSAEEPDE